MFIVIEQCLLLSMSIVIQLIKILYEEAEMPKKYYFEIGGGEGDRPLSLCSP